MTTGLAMQRRFFAFWTLIFIGSASLTIVWCGSMSAMGGMSMPGGWTMSMAWMRMPGQTWTGAAAIFIGMWTTMMVAMMLPSLLPMLWRFCQAASRMGETRLARLTSLVSAGYFLIWTLCGVIAYLLGTALSTVAMRIPTIASATPVAIGVVIAIAGALQFTAWKQRQLTCCPNACQRAMVASNDDGSAWRYGVQLGLRCCRCCFGMTAVLLCLGVMDLRAMAIVTAAITLERLLPRGERIARMIGAVTMVAGFLLIARAVGM